MGGFKKFVMRGNLIDMAVAVVIGVAFNNLVKSLITDLITPLITAVGNGPNFENLKFYIGNSPFKYGDFTNAIISFLVMAVVIYYLIVAPSSRLAALAIRKQAATERPCPECLSDIPVAAKRCKFCTAEVPEFVPEQSGDSSTLVDRLRNGSIWPPRSK